MLRKGIISLGAQLAVVLVLMAATIWAGNTLKDQTPKDIYAAGGTVALSFSPASITLPGTGVTQLNLKTETTNDKVGAVTINISFDQSKVKLAKEVTVGTALPQLLPGNTTMADANATGKIKIHLGVAPGDTANAPTGTVNLATLTWTAATTSTNVSAQVTIDTATSSVADITPQYLPITAQPLSIAINPSATATPTVRPTATNTPRPTATSTPRPTATSTPRPTATSTPRPTSTPTVRPTLPPGVTATPTRVPSITPTRVPTNTPVPSATPTQVPEATTTPIAHPTATVAPTSGVTLAPASGLVAAYAFEEGSGNTIHDLSGNNNNGTSESTNWTSGKYGGALRFGDYANRVVVPNSATLALTNGLTMEAWVKPSTTLHAWRAIVIKEQADELAWGLYGSGETSESYGIIFNNGSEVMVHGGNVPANSWTHIATTYDGSNLKQYVNGNLVEARQVSGDLVTSDRPLSIGADSVWKEETFPGLIDEVRIYNRALTSVEIGQDMAKPLAGSASGDDTAGTATFAAKEDQTILSSSRNSHDSKYGNKNVLRVDGSPATNFLVKFEVNGLDNKTVTSAKLRLYNTEGSFSGGRFYSTTNNWHDDTLTWKNAPAAYNWMGSLRWVSSKRWYEVDVTKFVTGNGTYSFRATSSSYDGASYSSIEGGKAPELKVSYK